MQHLHKQLVLLHAVAEVAWGLLLPLLPQPQGAAVPAEGGHAAPSGHGGQGGAWELQHAAM